MSSEPPCRTLGEYISELVLRFERHDPAAAERVRTIVGPRRARILVDDEAVVISWQNTFAVAIDDTEIAVDGEGTTSRQVVLDILDGYRELSDAIVDGAIEIRGTQDDVVRMGLAIEIVLDCATRDPSLQALADDFRRDPCKATSTLGRASVALGTRWFPRERAVAEDDVLRRHGILPSPPTG